MLTPRSKPARLTSMNLDAGPWNQVAVIQPLSCQTVLKRSQSPASRHSAQFCTVSMIASLSSMTDSLLLLDACFFPHRRPARDFGAQMRAERLRRRGFGKERAVRKRLANLVALKNGGYGAVYLRNDRSGRSCGECERVPGRDVVVCDARLGDGRRVRQHREALRRSHRERLQRAAAHLSEDG